MIQKITLLSTKTCFGVFSKTNDTSTHTTSSGKPDLCHPWEFFLSWYQQLSNGHFLGILAKAFDFDFLLKRWYDAIWSGKPGVDPLHLFCTPRRVTVRQRRRKTLMSLGWIKMFRKQQRIYHILCRKHCWQEILCLVRGVNGQAKERKNLLKKGGKKCFGWVIEAGTVVL